jgi:hypothetical protein|tara:strand:- start:6479 stop:6946 length:468 start_codon:yes stop_codon:yes gene_type:complete
MVPKSKYNKKGYIKSRKNGFRSGLEEKVAKQIQKANHKLRYEVVKIKWIDFAIRSYTPDFVLDNGIIIEVKGFWSVEDRKKHKELRKQHVNLDIRMVFENSKRKIRKGSKTSYGMWCDKNDILYHDRIVPIPWLQEQLKFMPPKIINVNQHSFKG